MSPFAKREGGGLLQHKVGLRDDGGGGGDDDDDGDGDDDDDDSCIA